MVELDASVLPGEGVVVKWMWMTAAALLVALVDAAVDGGDGARLLELSTMAESIG